MSEMPEKCFSCAVGKYKEETKDYALELPEGKKATIPDFLSFKCDSCKEEIIPPVSWKRADEVSAAHIAFKTLMADAQAAGTEDGLDIIFNNIFLGMSCGMLDHINDVLKNADPKQFDLVFAVGLLSATNPAAEKFQDRELFFQKVKQHAIDLGKYKRGLLTGLSLKEDFWQE